MRVGHLVADIVHQFNLSSWHVRMLPSRAIVNDGSDIGVLNGEEISIEGISQYPQSDIMQEMDERLKCVNNLLFSEELYLESLKITIDNYADPLWKWGLSELEYDTLFGGIKQLRQLNTLLWQKLKSATATWDSELTCIGQIFVFFDLFWPVYEEYYQSFKSVKLILKSKKSNDPTFSDFLRTQRLSAHHSLESLLLAPVQRIPQYNRLLGDLIEKTSEDHPDYKYLIETKEQVKQMISEREQEVKAVENEYKLIQIQERFPNDPLYLLDDRVAVAEMKSKSHAPRRRSAPTLFLKHNISFNKHSGRSIANNLFGMTANNKVPRQFIYEGVVDMNTGFQTVPRYLFLLNDILIIAKPKGSTFRLKNLIRVTDIWLSESFDDVCEVVQHPDKSFVIGWPIVNYLATFSTVEERNLWFQLLSKQIEEQQEYDDPKALSATISLRISEINPSLRDIVTNINITNKDDVHFAIKECLKESQLEMTKTLSQQLWIITNKEDVLNTPLIGHERLYAIKCFSLREGQENNGLDGVLETKNTQDSELQFVIRFRKGAKISALDIKKKGLSKRVVVQWLKHSTGSIKNSSPSKNQEPLAEKASGRIFGVPLEKLIQDDTLPKPLMGMLQQLSIYGPTTIGVFRRSANVKIIRELRGLIESGMDILYENHQVLVLAALLKEFLLSLPQPVFDINLFEEYLITNKIEDKEERINATKTVLQKQRENSKAATVLLNSIFCVLNRILAHCEENNMNAYNLTVCISSSMMWPKDLNIAHQRRDDIVEFFQFLLENCQEILGEEMQGSLGDAERPVRHKLNRRKAVSCGDAYTLDENEDSSNPSSSLKSICDNLGRRIANADTCGSHDSGIANSDLSHLGLENDDNSQGDNGSIATSDSSGGQEISTIQEKPHNGSGFGGIERHETRYGRFIKNIYQGNKQKGEKIRDSRSAFASNNKKNNNTNSPFLNKTRRNGRPRPRDDSACSEDSIASSAVSGSLSKDSQMDEESTRPKMVAISRHQSTPSKGRRIGGIIMKKLRNNSLGDGEEYSSSPVPQHKSSLGNNSDESDSTFDSKLKSRFAYGMKSNKKSQDHENDLSSSTPCSPLKKEFDSHELISSGSQPDFNKLFGGDGSKLDLPIKEDTISNYSKSSSSPIDIRPSRSYPDYRHGLTESHSDSHLISSSLDQSIIPVGSLRKVGTFPNEVAISNQSSLPDINNRDRGGNDSMGKVSPITRDKFLKMSFTEEEFV
ncbi:uncharacterized protein TRIADDRAFT_56489 [Trichoplax adhaerens]|uniref:Rho-GAP domain-containing protein n=1 Tax=Trichoplax adhaerens TaxID=10228 RepID=B3RYA2_TRIAD|nr:predicted protein [Trichoplax adhaerens]EDV24565.1 predicted protein [Trichoplax adhaerens]|eukprot:XP_002112455.1 predicted protein [Trichoplax adhaerens]